MLREAFDRFAGRSSERAGSPWAFALAVTVLAVWAVSGPLFGFSDTWQLVVNTATTIVTFLMVFVIQNTQNRDSAAVQIKLDEMIRAAQGAHNALLDLEELSERELEKFRSCYVAMASAARQEIRAGAEDTGSPVVRFPSDSD